MGTAFIDYLIDASNIVKLGKLLALDLESLTIRLWLDKDLLSKVLRRFVPTRVET